MLGVAQWNEPPKVLKFAEGAGDWLKPHSFKALIVISSFFSTITQQRARIV